MNFLSILNGFIQHSWKGPSDENNNGLYLTYDLHPQKFSPNPLGRKEKKEPTETMKQKEKKREEKRKNQTEKISNKKEKLRKRKKIFYLFFAFHCFPFSAENRRNNKRERK